MDLPGEACESPSLPVSGLTGLSNSEYEVVPPTDKSPVIQYQCCHNKSESLAIRLSLWFCFIFQLL